MHVFDDKFDGSRLKIYVFIDVMVAEIGVYVHITNLRVFSLGNRWLEPTVPYMKPTMHR